jgi:hypothetical protein
MSDSESDPLPSPTPPPLRIEGTVSQGVYASGLIVIHTRDEFMLDFIAGLDAPARIVRRILTTPAHLKRMLRALLENLGRYEQSYGCIAPQVENSRAKPGQVKDLYGQLQITDEVLGGTFSNGMVIKHSQDVFVMDFVVNFPPASKVNSRVIVSPGHLRRIIGVLGDNLAQYEDRFGKIDDGAPPSEQRIWFSLN